MRHSLEELSATLEYDPLTGQLATPGPWTVCGNQRDEWYVYALDARYESLPGNPSPVKVAWVPWEPSGGRHARDADYIAATSPDALLALLDALDAAERERDEARANAILDVTKLLNENHALKAERDAIAALLREARDVGCERIQHTYLGPCPDDLDRDSRDPECPACAVLLKIDALDGAKGAT